MMRGDYIFVAKWTLIVGGVTGAPGFLATLVAIHGGAPATYVSLILMPSMWVFREGWIDIDNFVTILQLAVVLHVFMVFVIVLALNTVLRRRRDIG